MSAVSGPNYDPLLEREAIRGAIQARLLSKEQWKAELNIDIELPPITDEMIARFKANYHPDAPNKTVGEACVVAFIPKTVKINGEEKPFTIRLLGEIMAPHFPESTNNSAFRYIWERFLQAEGDTPALVDIPMEESAYVFMGHELLTRGETYAEEEACIKKGEECVRPSPLQAVAVICLEYLRDKKSPFLFPDSKGSTPWSYIRTSFKIDNWHALVGGSASSGLLVYHYFWGSKRVGVVPLWEFSVRT